MSGINDWSEAERQLYALGSRALLDDIEEQRREWNSGAHVDRTSFDAQAAAAEARIAAMQNDTREWLKSLYTDEGAHQHSAQRGQQGTPGADVPPAGSAPAGRVDPRAAELAEAERIKGLSLDDFRAERERLGIRKPPGSRGLFD